MCLVHIAVGWIIYFLFISRSSSYLRGIVCCYVNCKYVSQMVVSFHLLWVVAVVAVHGFLFSMPLNFSICFSIASKF